MLDAQVAQREVAAADNAAKMETIANLKAAIEALGTHAFDQAEIIKVRKRKKIVHRRTDRQTDRQTDRPTDTDRQTSIQADIARHKILSLFKKMNE